MRLRTARVACAALALALPVAGCTSTAEKARKKVAEETKAAQATKLEIEKVAIIETSVEAVIPGAAGNVAVVVSFRSTDPAQSLVWAPIDVRLLDAAGTVVARTNEAGADPLLVHLPSIPPGGSGLYVNDQLYPEDPTAVVRAEATLGGSPAKLATPPANLLVRDARSTDDPDYGPGFRATIVNDGAVRQEQVIVQAVVRRGGEVVAAGTAVIPEGLDPGEEREIEGFLTGDPTGGTLDVVAPASNAAGVPGAAPSAGAVTSAGPLEEDPGTTAP